MTTHIRGQVAALAALALLGTAGAQASIVGVSAAGGSEALLNLVNATDSSSITLDLGEQTSQIAIGDFYTLNQSVLDFISGAGGLGNIRYSVIAGSAANGTSAAAYLHSSDNASLGSLANGVRGTWFTSLNTFILNRLNSSNPGDTDTAVNNAYGPFASGVSGNYGTMGTDDWGTAGSCAANDNQCNLVNGTLTANLFLISFGTSPTGLAGISSFLNAEGGAQARLNLAQNRLEIFAVPVPAAMWLMGSAIGLLGLIRRIRNTAVTSFS